MTAARAMGAAPCSAPKRNRAPAAHKGRQRPGGGLTLAACGSRPRPPTIGAMRFLLAEESGKFFAQCREGKSQARAALVAARRVDSNQRSARRTNLRPRLLLAAAEESAHRILPFFHAPLPPIRKRQFSSLRPTHRVPIIPKSPRFFSARRFFRGLITYGQIRRVRQAH